MATKRWYRFKRAGSLAAVTLLCTAFPAMAQYQQNPYGQAQQPNQPYGGQSQYNGAGGQAQAYPQTYAPQQVPAGQYPQQNFQYSQSPQNYSQGNNSQQFYQQQQGQNQPPGLVGGAPQYGAPPQSFAGGYPQQPQAQYPQQNPNTIYGYASDVQQAQQNFQYPAPQQGYQPQYPQLQQQPPAPVMGYQPGTPQQPGGLGLQQTAGAYFDQMDQQGQQGQQSTPAPSGGDNGGGGGGLGGKLAAGAKTLAGVAVPMATGFLMTQAANKQAKRMGIPSGGIFGNQYGYGSPYGMNPYGGMGGFGGGGLGGFGGSPLGGFGGGGGGLMNGLLGRF